MANVARVEATITARNHLRPGLNAAAGDLARFRATQTRAAKVISQSLNQARGLERMERAAGILRNSVAGFGGAFAAGMGLNALKQATTRFAAVDRAMARTGITGDATVEQTRRGAEELRNLARDAGIMFDPAQKGLDAITASGREFTDAMKMMPSVLKTAQASGAGVDDIANSSTALIDHMKISIEGLAEAQDTLAMGGKLGKFELKDMARYLPSMLPAYKAIGRTGQEGLRNLVAMLQVIRGGTGTAEEAAASAQNIFSKMESDETVKNFKEMGEDLPKAMTKARKEGRDLIDVFLELSNKALKGDLSKIPQLFKDMEVQRGMRPLLAGMQKMLELRGQLKGSAGTIDKDFLRISADTQASLDRFGESADRAKTALGALAAEAASPMLKTGASNLDALARAMERAAEAARSEGFPGALKRFAGDFGATVVKDIDEGQQGLQAAGDSATADRLAARRNGSSRLDDLTRRDPSSLSRQEVAELYTLRRRGVARPVALTDDEMAAVARDQQRRAGGLPDATLGSSSAEFDAVRGDAREARRARSWTSPATTPEGKPVPTVAKGKAQRGRALPPARPRNLGSSAMPGYGSDDGLEVPAQPKPRVEPETPAVKGWRENIQSSLAEFRASLKPGLDSMKWKRNQTSPVSTSRPIPLGPVDATSLDSVKEKVASAQTALDGLHLPTFTGSNFDLDTAALDSVKEKVASAQTALGGLRMPTFTGLSFDLDTAPLDSAKGKVDDVRSSVQALGPAGQSAGGAMAGGFEAGLSRMEAAADATIARIQQKLNSLKAPSLNFGGPGGFDTGKQGPN